MGNILFWASFILSQQTVIIIYCHHLLRIYFYKESYYQLKRRK